MITEQCPHVKQIVDALLILEYIEVSGYILPVKIKDANNGKG